METFRSIRAAKIAADLIEVAALAVSQMTAYEMKAKRGEGRPCAIRKEYAKVAKVAKIDFWRADQFLDHCPEFPDIAERRKEMDDIFDAFSQAVKFFA